MLKPSRALIVLFVALFLTAGSAFAQQPPPQGAPPGAMSQPAPHPAATHKGCQKANGCPKRKEKRQQKKAQKAAAQGQMPQGQMQPGQPPAPVHTP
jgi:hypothetical protein